jgi:hypothetical protein
MTLLDEIAGVGRRDSEPARRAIEEIAEALLEMGGSAHRDVVIDRVAIRRGQLSVSEGLRRELVSAFDRHCAAAAGEGGSALFHLPFGEGSRRWSLTRDAMRRVSSTEPLASGRPGCAPGRAQAFADDHP